MSHWKIVTTQEAGQSITTLIGDGLISQWQACYEANKPRLMPIARTSKETARKRLNEIKEILRYAQAKTGAIGGSRAKSAG